MAGLVHHKAYARTHAPIPAVLIENPDQFHVLYPGVYTEHEKPHVEKYFTLNAAIKARGPVDLDALVAGTLPKETVGLGPTVKASEAWVRYNNAKYDGENKLRNDRDYARSKGYKDILAFPAFAAHDDSFMTPYPPAARDTFLVSDLNHSVNFLNPIYPGDTLFMVMESRDMIDITPAEGSLYRSIVIESKGTVFNQRKEKVNEVIFRVTESIRVNKDKYRPEIPDFKNIWEAPNWMERKAHYYTDADWKKIKTIWANEKRQGTTPLYWHDVKVGDRPIWTLDGPIEASVAPIAPWGMGVGGSRTIRTEIMDPEIFKTLERDKKTGI